MLLLNIVAFFTFIFTVLIFLVFLIRLIIFFFRKKRFPKKLFVATLAGTTLFLALFVYRTYFFTFDRINTDYMQNGPGPVASPGGTYRANAYYEPYGGAVGGVNVWVEITNNLEKSEVKIVYYGDAKSHFSMEWKDEDTLYILNTEPADIASNRSIELDINKEIYHEFGLACESWLLKDEYEKCYQN